MLDNREIALDFLHNVYLALNAYEERKGSRINASKWLGGPEESTRKAYQKLRQLLPNDLFEPSNDNETPKLRNFTPRANLNENQAIGNLAAEVFKAAYDYRIESMSDPDPQKNFYNGGWKSRAGTYEPTIEQAVNRFSYTQNEIPISKEIQNDFFNKLNQFIENLPDDISSSRFLQIFTTNLDDFVKILTKDNPSAIEDHLSEKSKDKLFHLAVKMLTIFINAHSTSPGESLFDYFSKNILFQPIVRRKNARNENLFINKIISSDMSEEGQDKLFAFFLLILLFSENNFDKSGLNLQLSARSFAAVSFHVLQIINMMQRQYATKHAKIDNAGTVMHQYDGTDTLYTREDNQKAYDYLARRLARIKKQLPERAEPTFLFGMIKFQDSKQEIIRSLGLNITISEEKLLGRETLLPLLDLEQLIILSQPESKRRQILSQLYNATELPENTRTSVEMDDRGLVLHIKPKLTEHFFSSLRQAYNRVLDIEENEMEHFFSSVHLAYNRMLGIEENEEAKEPTSELDKIPLNYAVRTECTRIFIRHEYDDNFNFISFNHTTQGELRIYMRGIARYAASTQDFGENYMIKAKLFGSAFAKNLLNISRKLNINSVIILEHRSVTNSQQEVILHIVQSIIEQLRFYPEITSLELQNTDRENAVFRAKCIADLYRHGSLVKYRLTRNERPWDDNTAQTVRRILPGPNPELKNLFDNAIKNPRNEALMQQFLQQLSSTLKQQPHETTKYKFLITGEKSAQIAYKIAGMSKDYLPLILNGVHFNSSDEVCMVFSKEAPAATRTLLTQARDKLKPVATESQSDAALTTETAEQRIRP